jgi:hypothetical protein
VWNAPIPQEVLGFMLEKEGETDDAVLDEEIVAAASTS